jgi:hypothetical protein
MNSLRLYTVSENNTAALRWVRTGKTDGAGLKSWQDLPEMNRLLLLPRVNTTMEPRTNKNQLIYKFIQILLMQRTFRQKSQRFYTIETDDPAHAGVMLLGVYSTYLIPREEEPQIQVPMADLLISFPGASPQEVETRWQPRFKNHIQM